MSSAAPKRAVQFLHIATYSRKPNPVGQHVEQILGEAERRPQYSAHVAAPEPPRPIFGLSIGELWKAHDVMISRARTQIQKPDGSFAFRALRKDRHTLGTAVASWPVERRIIERDLDEMRRYEIWRDLHVGWFRKLWGEGNFQTILEHGDETYLHLHAYALPLTSEDCDARRLCNPAFAAKLEALEQGEAEGMSKLEALKRANRAYKDVGRQLQDEYFAAVGAPSGLLRDGPLRRRMSRAEWRRETNLSRQASDALMERRVRKMEGLEEDLVQGEAALELQRRRAILELVRDVRRQAAARSLERRSTALEESLQAQQGRREAVSRELDAAEERLAGLEALETDLRSWVGQVESVAEKLPQLLGPGPPVSAIVLSPLRRAVREEASGGPLARLLRALEGMAGRKSDLDKRGWDLQRREEAVLAAETQAELWTQGLEAAVERLPDLLKSEGGDPQKELEQLGPPEGMEKKGRGLFLRLRESLASFVGERRKLDLQAQELQTREAALGKDRRNLEDLQGWIQRALGNLGVLLDRIQAGMDAKEIAPADMASYPAAQFEVLKQAAPEGRPTFGFRARFWSFHFSNGQSYAFPEAIGKALASAFDRAEVWAQELRAHREALRALEAQERALQARQEAQERLERGRGKLEAAFALLQAGAYGQAISQEEQDRRPELLAAFGRVLPGRRPTRGLLLRFEALHAPDGSPLPLPEPEREKLSAGFDEFEAQEAALQKRRSVVEDLKRQEAALAPQVEALEARRRQAELLPVGLAEMELRAAGLRSELEDLEAIKAQARSEGLTAAERDLAVARSLLTGDLPEERLGEGGVWLRGFVLQRREASDSGRFRDGVRGVKHRSPERWEVLTQLVQETQEKGWPHSGEAQTFAEQCAQIVDRLCEFWSKAAPEVLRMSRRWPNEIKQAQMAIVDHLPFPDDRSILLELRTMLEKHEQAAKAERELVERLQEMEAEPIESFTASGPSMG